MSDPTWLPSTIMQTIGALYGIFIAIFILVIQGLFKIKERIEQKDIIQKFDLKIKILKNMFTILSYFVIVTELYNGMLVYFISDSIYEQFKYCLFISFILFALLITYIIWFSYYMISFYISIGTEDESVSIESFSGFSGLFGLGKSETIRESLFELEDKVFFLYISLILGFFIFGTLTVYFTKKFFPSNNDFIFLVCFYIGFVIMVTLFHKGLRSVEEKYLYGIPPEDSPEEVKTVFSEIVKNKAFDYDDIETNKFE